MQLNGMKCKLAAVRMHKWCECCVTEAKCRHIAKSFLLFFLNAIVSLLLESPANRRGDVQMMLRRCRLKPTKDTFSRNYQCEKSSSLAEQVLVLKVVKTHHYYSSPKAQGHSFFCEIVKCCVFIICPHAAHCMTLQKPTGCDVEPHHCVKL